MRSRTKTSVAAGIGVLLGILVNSYDFEYDQFTIYNSDERWVYNSDEKTEWPEIKSDEKTEWPQEITDKKHSLEFFGKKIPLYTQRRVKDINNGWELTGRLMENGDIVSGDKFVPLWTDASALNYGFFGPVPLTERERYIRIRTVEHPGFQDHYFMSKKKE